jgi:tetratricopeptide (TPR) repeat protein
MGPRAARRTPTSAFRAARGGAGQPDPIAGHTAVGVGDAGAASAAYQPAAARRQVRRRHAAAGLFAIVAAGFAGPASGQSGPGGTTPAALTVAGQGVGGGTFEGLAAAQAIRDRAREEIRLGRLVEADAHLAEAERIETVAGPARSVALEAQASAVRRLVRAACDRGTRGEIALARLDYVAAAAHFRGAAALVPADHPDERGRWLTRWGDALRQRGDEAALRGAVAAYEAALREHTRTRVPLRWATTQDSLGATLRALGEREGGTARLEEAVAAFRAALQERTRGRAPLDWAETQANLGATLHLLGTRGGGATRLEEAVAAYRAALEEYTRASAPLHWAGTQTNLGSALLLLGSHEPGAARLEAAVAAYGAALEEYTRERMPLHWAETQHRLALAQESLADRLRDPARMADALARVRGAAEVYRAGAVGHRLSAAEANEARMRAKLTATDGAMVGAGPAIAPPLRAARPRHLTQRQMAR